MILNILNSLCMEIFILSWIFKEFNSPLLKIYQNWNQANFFNKEQHTAYSYIKVCTHTSVLIDLLRTITLCPWSQTSYELFHLLAYWSQSMANVYSNNKQIYFIQFLSFAVNYILWWPLLISKGQYIYSHNKLAALFRLLQ